MNGMSNSVCPRNRPMEAQNIDIGPYSRTKVNAVRDQRHTGTSTIYVSTGAMLQLPGIVKTQIPQQLTYSHPDVDSTWQTYMLPKPTLLVH